MNDLAEYHMVPVPRTLKLPGRTWKTVKAKGKRDGKPVREVLKDAVDAELTRLVRRLRELGVRGELVNDKVVRIPVSDVLLDRLRKAKEQTGLPSIQLLALCLQHHADRRRQRKRSPRIEGDFGDLVTAK